MSPLLVCSQGPAQHQPVHAWAHVSEVSLVALFEFSNGAPRVADFTKGLTHSLPVHVAITEVHPLVSILLALEVLQVDLDDALPQSANPVLRIAAWFRRGSVQTILFLVLAYCVMRFWLRRHRFSLSARFRKDFRVSDC